MIGVLPKILLKNMNKWKYKNDKMVAIGTVSSEIQDAIDKQNNININKADKDKYAIYIGLNVTGADHLAIDGGEDPKDFHVTLLYGYYQPVSDVEDTAMRIQSCREKAVKYLPDTLKLDTIGRFEASESSDGKDVIYARVAPGQLEEAHKILLKELNDRGLKVQTTFDEYNPHMTLAYIDPDEEVELGKIDTTVTIKNLSEGFETDEATSKENTSTFKIAKTDEDKRLVFGWALVAKDKNGNVIQDHQNDIVEEDELEEGAYQYVLNFRDSGEEHISTLRKKGKMVESCVFTEEKQRAMGIPEGIVPVGWWIGFYVEDDAAWEKIKDGTYTMFSIEGRAIRVPVDEVETTDDLTKSVGDYLNDEYTVAKTFGELIEKFNPYHGKDGRFTSPGGGFASFTYKPGQGKMYDNAIAREKERVAGMASSGSSASGSKPMTEQEYLDSKGVGDATSGWVLDKLRGNRQIRTQRGKERFEREGEKAEAEYQKRREQARQEYKEKVKNGELRDKTYIENIVDRANGNPDNPSVQAARRLAEKRGIDWRTGKPLKENGTGANDVKAIRVTAPDGTVMTYRDRGNGQITGLDNPVPKNTNNLSIKQIQERAKQMGYKVETYDDKQLGEHDTKRKKEREETNRQLNNEWYRAAPKPRKGWKGH